MTKVTWGTVPGAFWNWYLKRQRQYGGECSPHMRLNLSCYSVYACYDEGIRGKGGSFWMAMRKKGGRRNEGELGERQRKAIRRLVLR